MINNENYFLKQFFQGRQLDRCVNPIFLQGVFLQYFLDILRGIFQRRVFICYQNGFYIHPIKNSKTSMKNIYNALSDVVSKYKANVLEYDILQHIPEDNLWIVNIYNRDAPGSVLQIEIIDDYGVPLCCVLQKVNVGRKSMAKFMDRLLDALDDEQLA